MFVAVHAGAGFHSDKRAGEYTAAMCAAVDRAWRALSDPSSGTPPTSLSAVAAAVASLEESGVANAGRGSNLAADGTAEADASVMRGEDHAFGAVAAVPGLRHPSRAAALLATESALPLPLGLVRPTMLAGDGARRWALSRGLEGEADAARAPAYLAQSERARRAWRRHRRALDEEEEEEAARQQGRGAAGAAAAAAGAAATRGRKRARTTTGAAQGDAAGAQNDDDPDDGEVALDTVGAIALDAQGRCSAAVSSGGLAMKTPGRVGSAAVLGAACWAQDGQARAEGGGRRPSVAVSASGVGERLVLASLARVAAAAGEAAEAPASYDDDDDDGGGLPPPLRPLPRACDDVLHRLVLCGPPPRDAGVIACRALFSESGDSVRRVEFAACFTSRSFAIAYRGPSMESAEALIMHQTLPPEPRPQRPRQRQRQRQRQMDPPAAAGGASGAAASPRGEVGDVDVVQTLARAWWPS
jgi:taspase (threonine aspartase 1)